MVFQSEVAHGVVVISRGERDEALEKCSETLVEGAKTDWAGQYSNTNESRIVSRHHAISPNLGGDLSRHFLENGSTKFNLILSVLLNEVLSPISQTIPDFSERIKLC
jgi:hypothetical protein